ncbi:hypothetical protein [Paenibacillus protaetiae]|uniref:Uncharacterized protein n=1 Tax=Paenibacillus protaetiae TaxID=2509456 RepID=A0A4P6EUC4_9BACL|nr:hypothetical protein [Paenibacillus protaetiae]QAY65239.1 hypothetical protein ET464_01420 [Paenibacillus protaetiae]
MERKEGVVNEIIYENTAYHNGKYRYYPTITGLKSLIKEIIESNSTTNYIRVTPFYVNEKIDRQIEFDDYMFYMESRDQFDDNDLKEYIGACVGREYADLNSEEVEYGQVLYPLFKNEDVATFQKALGAYLHFLDVLIPKLMEISRLKMALVQDDLAFGYFCFEVHSG